MTTPSPDSALLVWEAKQPEAITGDPLWRLHCYREAMFLMDLVREDLNRAEPQPAHGSAREQLFTSVASISANIAEGYGRPTAADRVRFFGYALGSAREAVTWAQSLRLPQSAADTDDRLVRLARIRRMLLGLLSRLRTKGGRKFDSW